MCTINCDSWLLVWILFGLVIYEEMKKLKKKIVLTVQVIFCIVFLSIRSTSLFRFIHKQYYLYRIDLLHYDKRSFKKKLKFNMLIRSCRHMIRKINKKIIFNVIRQSIWFLRSQSLLIFKNPLIKKNDNAYNNGTLEKHFSIMITLFKKENPQNIK